MDPIAHTFTGAALAASGLRRATPLATAALLIGANAPDIDVVTSFGGTATSLALRRGWTHGVLAIVVLPLLIAGGLLLWDRWRRRRTGGIAAPARAGPLLALAFLGVATHPTLDWLNNYGMRWLMPFDGRWFYGDALFIIDPWVWLVLGGVLFLGRSRRPAALAAWGVFWLLASFLMLTTPQVPAPARTVWVVGLASLLAFRRFGRRFAVAPAGAAVDTSAPLERPARGAVGVIALYMTAAALANVPARNEVRATLAAQGIHDVESVMVAPAAANPFAGTVVAATPSAYYLGEWHWLARPRFRMTEEPLARRPVDTIVEAAAEAPAARRFLTWSRFPHFDVERTSAGGYDVEISDVRYRGMGRLGGVIVELDARLEPVGAGPSSR